MTLADRYQSIVKHYAALESNPATVDHARHMVREFRNIGLESLPEDVAKVLNAKSNPPMASNGEHVLQERRRPNEDQRKWQEVPRGSG